MVTPLTRQAFTLIEMLITMIVIVTLMGLLFAAARSFMPAAKKGKSNSVLAQVVTALESARASGAGASLSEHPLAASAGILTVRAAFLRHRSSDVALASSGEALVGVTLADLPAMGVGDGQPNPGSRLLLPDDHLEDSRQSPHLYGMPRRQLQVIGDGLKNVTYYRRLPKPVIGSRAVSAGRTNDIESAAPPNEINFWTSGNMTASKFINAAGGTTNVLRREFLRVCSNNQPFKDLDGLVANGGENVHHDFSGVGFVIPGYALNRGSYDPNGLGFSWTWAAISPATGSTSSGGTVADCKKSFEASLGPALTEIAKLGGVYQPSSDTPLIRNERLWTDGTTASAWEAGYTQDGGTWKGYRLRGPAIYDAWNTEILVFRNAKDGFVAMSAGIDGVFRWHPGKNATLNTAATAFGVGETVDVGSPVIGPAGDDQWGGRDNIVVGDL